MTLYKINDIFYSLQGEGVATGQPAVFIRFSGCNLKCSFCDTEFSEYEKIPAEEIILLIKEMMPERMLKNPNWRIVLTGGEPTLQIDAPLLNKLREEFGEERVIQIETNATTLAEKYVMLDGCFLTASPKNGKGLDALRKYFSAHKDDENNSIEVKAVFDETNHCLRIFLGILEEMTPSNVPLSIQPCDYQNADLNNLNLEKCITFVKDNPRWRLSLQTHKLLNIK